jgi:hypothetical protein
MSRIVREITIICVLVGLLGAIGGMPEAQSAIPIPRAPLATCSIQHHCYGRARWVSERSASTGSGGDLLISCLLSPEPQKNFTTQEMWQGTNNSLTGSDWVEQGASYGYPRGGHWYWFWADRTPVHGYREHDLQFPAVAFHVPYSIEIFYNWGAGVPPHTWSVEENTLLIGVSKDNPSPGRYLAAGTELTNRGGKSKGIITSLAWLDTHHARHLGWGGASTQDTGGRTTTKWLGRGHIGISWTSRNC